MHLLAKTYLMMFELMYQLYTTCASSHTLFYGVGMYCLLGEG